MLQAKHLYQWLLSALTAREAAQRPDGAQQLLSNASLQLALLAVSCQLVAATYAMVSR